MSAIYSPAWFRRGQPPSSVRLSLPDAHAGRESSRNPVSGVRGFRPDSPCTGSYTVSLVENLERLKLDYEKILGLHGRLATKDELMKAAGRGETKPVSK